MWDLWWTKWYWGRFSPSTSFPLPIFIPPTAPQSLWSIIRGWYNRPVVAAVPSGLSLTPPQEKTKTRTEVFHVFSQSFQINWIASRTRSRSLPSKFFPVHYLSVLIHRLHIVMLLGASLCYNIPEIKPRPLPST
jgi:hypothetical protein